MTGPFLAASGLTPRCSACSVILTGKSDRCPHCGAARSAGPGAPLNGARGAVGHAAAQVSAQFDGPLIGLLIGPLSGPLSGHMNAQSKDYANAAASGDFTGHANAAGVRRSGWGPSSSAALSLFVFVLVFALAVMLGQSRFGHDVASRVAGTPLTPLSTTLPPPGVAPQIAPLHGASPQPVVDAALARARACNAAQTWDCVSSAAREVIARDPGNREAQALLERAIAQSGWQGGADRAGVGAAGVDKANGASRATRASSATAHTDVMPGAVATTAPAASASVQPNRTQAAVAMVAPPAAAASSDASASLHAVLSSSASDETKQQAISSMGWRTAAVPAR